MPNELDTDNSPSFDVRADSDVVPHLVRELVHAIAIDSHSGSLPENVWQQEVTNGSQARVEQWSIHCQAMGS